MDHGIILWSSITPTQIKQDGVIATPRPFEVIYFDNTAVYHRRPPEAPRDRWMYRMRVKK
jgi:hypothetical protein